MVSDGDAARAINQSCSAGDINSQQQRASTSSSTTMDGRQTIGWTRIKKLRPLSAEVFAMHPAPVQMLPGVVYFGTMGGDFISNFLTDRIVSPVEIAPRMHNERLVYLRTVYQINDHKQSHPEIAQVTLLRHPHAGRKAISRLSALTWGSLRTQSCSPTSTRFRRSNLIYL
jgi:hypothetical protein